MTAAGRVHYDVHDNVATISLERAPVNALSVPFLDEILEALRRGATDENVRAVVLRSAVPDRFCAGLDMDILLGKPAAEIRDFVGKLYSELRDVQSAMTKPTIAAVNGAARGGGMTLAISCDVILASEASTFGYPEIDLGLVPAIHFAHLHRILGRHRAFELLFSGRSFDAGEARELGLVSRVLPEGALDAGATALANTFAGKSPTALRAGRAAFLRASDMGYRRGIEEAVDDFADVAATPDAQEGLRAFLEKRGPSWKKPG